MFSPQAQSLTQYNTFGIDVTANYFTKIDSMPTLLEAIRYARKEQKTIRVLGGGSNILLTKNPDDFILHNGFTGIETVEENDDAIVLKIGAGENWHQTVLFCVENGYGGIENLSLIPGNVGASPIQNIGAYGVEVKDRIVSVEAVDLQTGEVETFANEECNFAYRDSIFKSQFPGKYMVKSVSFRLDKKNHQLLTHYGAIAQELEIMGVKDPCIKDLSNAVISIRQSKLPDPRKLGNSGSFFKNPIVSKVQAEALLAKHPEAPNYPAGENVKFAAGWLIEQCGWKGKVVGNCGVHAKQALVLVNYGGATGQEIFDLSTEVLASVKAKFGVDLEREVNVW
jgi:UDP-N-acetylmuramate dehydrogenase